MKSDKLDKIKEKVKAMPDGDLKKSLTKDLKQKQQKEVLK